MEQKNPAGACARLRAVLVDGGVLTSIELEDVCRQDLVEKIQECYMRLRRGA